MEVEECSVDVREPNSDIQKLSWDQNMLLGEYQPPWRMRGNPVAHAPQAHIPGPTSPEMRLMDSSQHLNVWYTQKFI
jgi:hypothetical protein